MGSQALASLPAKILALCDEIAPAQFLLEHKICIIGRSELCQIVVSTKTVSRLQAVIEQDDSGCYVLHDINSANGTYINGQPVDAPHRLKDGDEIGLGTVTAQLLFQAVPQTIPTEKTKAKTG